MAGVWEPVSPEAAETRVSHSGRAGLRSTTLPTASEPPEGLGEPGGVDRTVASLNLKGALPLIALGSFLVVYAVVLSLEEPALPGGHLEIWELVVAVGSVILGAGVFSLFLAEPPDEERSTTAASRRRPESESERPEPQAPPPRSLPAGEPTPSVLFPASTSSRAELPPWWEGPPTVGEPPPLTNPIVTPTRATGSPRSTVAARLPPTNPPIRGPTYHSTKRAAPPGRLPVDIAEALAEWEAIARSPKPQFAQHPVEPPKDRTGRCADCNRPIDADPGARGCRQCGRRLCTECSSSALQSTGQVACIDCLLRPIVR